MKLSYLSHSAKPCRFKHVYGRVFFSELFRMESDDKCLTKALRTTLIVLFTLQLVSTVERQVFDFLGYMWAPIIGNFFQIIVVILGIFGAWNFYKSFIVVYATWSLLWLGWNIFVICLYLEVGILNRNRERYILTIGTDSKSWWLEHGIGCEIANTSWMDEEEEVYDSGRRIPPESSVVGCILQYYYVEVIHAAVQCFLSLAGFVASCVSIYSFMEEDDPMSSANDELEFVKMRYRTPTHMSAYRDVDDDGEHMAFDNINLTTEFTPHSPAAGGRRGVGGRGEREQPPSYDTTMRNVAAATAAANHYYAADRQSVRSKASTRSKRSTHHRHGAGAGPGSSATYSEPVRDLPWVQITPSTSAEQHMIRHYP
ncbi:sodium/potassium-transporting ATPase subunit beta-1-interacting protein [Aplysia californica]|uniref:Sodium/potassium-transporting ATPase subunit beta-1-interacting protein n=1 Tax=Aplysia californica TaxID=6500 RepID=A0ABM0KAU4_APLCA|nr:sodium/potassium-transporting ATPase subunit beta-1-interacting protein [Aplysia californica]